MSYSKAAPLVLAVLCLTLWPTLIKAQSDSQIQQAQARLSVAGLDPGPIDGVMGQQTRAALRQYQATRGLPATGRLDSATRKSLGLKGRRGGKAVASDAFVIPLEVEVTNRKIKVRGEIKIVEGVPENLLFSADCSGCQLDLPFSEAGFQELIWASGAEHIYKGGSVPSSYKTSMISNEISTDKEGRIIFVARAGETITGNRLLGWYFESDPAYPLTFKVMRKRGYVHIGGTGVARSPTGEIYQLGNEVEAKKRQRVEQQRQAKQLAELLRRSQRQISAQKFTKPLGDNAFETYQEMLKIHPGHLEAEAGITAIKKHYVQRAGEAEQSEDWTSAKAYYEEARKIDPQDESLRVARDKIEENVTVPPSLRSSLGVEFVRISTGKLQIGSSSFPISQPFYMGKYEVTQAQWEAVMGKNPSYFQGNPNRPVDNVSWEEVQTFLRRFNAQEGGSLYRLPTDIEWEYAVRAGSKTISFRDDISQLGDYGWFRENSGRGTRPVGQLEPNAWGLYDMHGNVWEWVQVQGLPTASVKRIQGGSWNFASRTCRSACSIPVAPDHKNFDLGFRLLRTVPRKPRSK